MYDYVMAEALQSFDSVVVELQNPVLGTPQGRLAMAQQMMQFAGITGEQALQVATSGNLGPPSMPPASCNTSWTPRMNG